MTAKILYDDKYDTEWLWPWINALNCKSITDVMIILTWILTEIWDCLSSKPQHAVDLLESAFMKVLTLTSVWSQLPTKCHESVYFMKYRCVTCLLLTDFYKVMEGKDQTAPGLHFVGKKDDLIQAKRSFRTLDGRDVLIIHHEGVFHAMDSYCHRK